jgi:hypothetical protein
MSKRKRNIERNQAVFDFEAKVEAYQTARADLLGAWDNSTDAPEALSRAEACIDLAAAIKRAIRSTGFSREEIVDQINAYFTDGKPLSLHMFNHFLSKPEQYPVPAYYLVALMEITGSLEIVQALVEPLGGRVISRDEVRQMNLGKLEELLTGLQKLKRELKGGK